MELKETGKDYLDLDFEVPEAGVSILQFEEGIQKRTNEKTCKTTLQLPLVIDSVVEGPAENKGKKMSHFVPIETEFGEKQLAGILTITGLMPGFAKKFGNDVDVTDDAFINALKLKLPGKLIKVAHEVRKDQGGKDRANVTRFEKPTGGGPSKPAPAPQPPGAGTGAGGDDW
jgi:hypothetical protein